MPETGREERRSLDLPVLHLTGRGLSVAETTKLSVGQALEKLRGTEAPKAKMARQDEKIQALDEETQRLRAMRRRLERDQRPVSPPCDIQEVNVKRATKLKISGIIIGIIIVIPILVWKWGLLSP
jgi:hypothetical protein